MNDFSFVGTCLDTQEPEGGPDIVKCSTQVYDKITHWASNPLNAIQIADSNPKSCYIIFWWCTFPQDYVRFTNSALVQLPRPRANDIANGITFKLKIITRARAAGQNGLLLSMNEVFQIKTLGRRWAMRTWQKSPSGAGDAFDLTPWEPYNYPGNVNLYESVYYTFTPDGRLRIDKFTPYQTPTNETKYIWEESINDGGWPTTCQQFRPTWSPHSMIRPSFTTTTTLTRLGGTRDVKS